jgi:CRISPR-associated protein Cas6
MPVEFPIRGTSSFPQDHGYALLGALTSRLPSLHGRDTLQVAPLRGTRQKDNHIRPDRNTRLHIRGLSSEERKALTLTWIDLNGAVLLVGEPKEKKILPSTRLVSRITIFQGDVTEPEFLKRLFTEMARFGNTREVEVSIGRSRAMKMGLRHFIGNSVTLTNIPDDISVAIQEQGLGWGTSMGCGVFYPGNPRCS